MGVTTKIITILIAILYFYGAKDIYLAKIERMLFQRIL